LAFLSTQIALFWDRKTWKKAGSVASCSVRDLQVAQEGVINLCSLSLELVQQTLSTGKKHQEHSLSCLVIGIVFEVDREVKHLLSHHSCLHFVRASVSWEPSPLLNGLFDAEFVDLSLVCVCKGEDLESLWFEVHLFDFVTLEIEAEVSLEIRGVDRNGIVKNVIVGSQCRISPGCFL